MPQRLSHGLLLEVYKTVVHEASAAYCSMPITSGRRYISWLKRIGKTYADIDAAHEKYHQAHVKEVIKPNQQHAQEVVKRLRETCDQVVIDPSGLPVLEGWTQTDWRSFWQQVLEHYVNVAFFIDDWQYSNGCTYEFWVAHKNSIPTFDEDRQPLTLEDGIARVEAAIVDMKELGASPVFLEKVLYDLRRLVEVPGKSRILQDIP